MSDTAAADLDAARCYAAVTARDRRFDGRFVTGVTSTGIFCRPSCPARTPKRGNVRFYRDPAAARAAGFRACLRCRPEEPPQVTPGGGARTLPADGRGELAARALRLLAAGTADATGIGGVARRLAVSERQLRRVLAEQVGAAPLALARTRRAQTARLLLVATTLPLDAVAFTAGFGSLRQFHAVIRETFAMTPGQLRRAGAGADGAPAEATVCITLPAPDAHLLGFLADRAVPGLESCTPDGYARVLRLPHGPATVQLELDPDDPTRAAGRLRLADLRDTAPAVAALRALLDAEANADVIDAALRRDPRLAGPVTARPGLRVPGSVDGFETATRAVLGQQVSVGGARTLLSRLVERYGTPLAVPLATLRLAFPPPEQIAALDPGELAGIGLPQARAAALVGLAAAVAGGLDLTRGADPDRTRDALLALPGIGPWTAGYVAMRALGDPDVLPAGDLGLRRAAGMIGLPDTAAGLAAAGQRWAPWRSYAATHLWACLPGPPGRSDASGAAATPPTTPTPPGRP